MTRTFDCPVPIDKRLKEYPDTLIKLLNTLCFVLIEHNSDNRQLLKDYAVTKKVNSIFQSDGKQENDPDMSLKNYFSEINKIHIPIDLGSTRFGIISDNPLGSFIEYIETGYLDTKQIIKNYEHILSNGVEYDNAYDTLKNADLRDGKDLETALGIIISKIKSNSEFFTAQNLAEIFDMLKDVHDLLSDEQKDIFMNIKNSIEDKILKFDKIDELDKESINISSFNLEWLPENHELYDMIQKALAKTTINIKEDSKTRIITDINKSKELQGFFYSMDGQYAKMICEPQFLKQITVRPFAITLFTRIIDNKKLFENNMESFENLANYINELPVYPDDKHLQKQIDKLKEKIKSIKAYIARDID